MLNSIPGVKQDWKEDWKEDARVDWRYDWDEIPNDLPAAPLANTVLPVITGTVQVGEVLTVNTGTWTGNPAPTFQYSWLFSATGLAGSWAHTGNTTNTLIPTGLQEDGYFFVQVGASNGGAVTWVETLPVGPVLPE